MAQTLATTNSATIPNRTQQQLQSDEEQPCRSAAGHEDLSSDDHRDDGDCGLARAVWEVLSDTAAHPDWNPFVRRLDGAPELGSKITVELRPGQKKPQTMRPRIVDCEPGHSFTWLGHVGVPGLLDGRHTFAVEAAGEATRLVQHEVLSGALTPLLRSMLTRDTRKPSSR